MKQIQSNEVVFTPINGVIKAYYNQRIEQLKQIRTKIRDEELLEELRNNTSKAMTFYLTNGGSPDVMFTTVKKMTAMAEHKLITYINRMHTMHSIVGVEHCIPKPIDYSFLIATCLRQAKEYGFVLNSKQKLHLILSNLSKDMIVDELVANHIEKQIAEVENNG
jgi:hypothetical protein